MKNNQTLGSERPEISNLETQNPETQSPENQDPENPNPQNQNSNNPNPADTRTNHTSIPFRGFDDRAEVRSYFHGILPHWRQADCTYFVTYRLADAIPLGVVREFEYERDQWLRTRGIELESTSAIDWQAILRGLSDSDRRLFERTMAQHINRYLDAGYGSCVLKLPSIAEVVANSLTHFHGERVLTGDFVVMPNHVHVLLRPINGFELEDILQAIKSYTATSINRMLARKSTLWMKESYDHIVRDVEQLEAFQMYIRANPTKANLRSDEYVLRQATYSLE